VCPAAAGGSPCCCGAAFHSPRHDFADIGSTTQSRKGGRVPAHAAGPHQERLAMNSDTMATDVDSGVHSSSWSVVQAVAL
jgi:hypothetical protein